MGGQQTLGREFAVLEHIRETATVRQSAGAELNVNEVVTQELETHRSAKSRGRRGWIAVNARKVSFRDVGDRRQEKLEIDEEPDHATYFIQASLVREVKTSVATLLL